TLDSCRMKSASLACHSAMPELCAITGYRRVTELARQVDTRRRRFGLGYISPVSPNGSSRAHKFNGGRFHPPYCTAGVPFGESPAFPIARRRGDAAPYSASASLGRGACRGCAAAAVPAAPDRLARRFCRCGGGNRRCRTLCAVAIGPDGV